MDSNRRHVPADGRRHFVDQSRIKGGRPGEGGRIHRRLKVAQIRTSCKSRNCGVGCFNHQIKGNAMRDRATSTLCRYNLELTEFSSELNQVVHFVGIGSVEGFITPAR